MQMVISKVHPACHSIVNGFKPGIALKRSSIETLVLECNIGDVDSTVHECLVIRG